MEDRIPITAHIERPKSQSGLVLSLLEGLLVLTPSSKLLRVTAKLSDYQIQQKKPEAVNHSLHGNYTQRMQLSVIEIKNSLVAFADKWSGFSGTERSASQTFLNGLISSYTGKADVFEAGGRFEEFGPKDDGSGYMDLFWPGKVIFEMKRPTETDHLDRHRKQALEYWRNSANQAEGRAAPPYLVICSFHEFEIWQPGSFPNAPVDRFRLSDLPARFESLAFLTDYTTRFGGDGPAVTEKAAGLMVSLFNDLANSGVPVEDAQRFTFQVIWELFAEDLGVVEHRPLEQLCRALLVDENRTAATAVYDLFQRLNTADPEERNAGLKTKLPYVNGELFSSTKRVHLKSEHLQSIVEAATFDWTKVNPAIFGTLLEGAMGPEKREVLGAHYTSEDDILAVVRPTIVQPWLAKIAEAASYKALFKIYQELLKFKVLDPAMGSGNFLAIAYRELRFLENLVRQKMSDYQGGQESLDIAIYPVSNLYGIEIDETSALLAKVTLWMTQAIESYRYGRAHDVLPLDNLNQNIVVGDALYTDWPEVDAIIGNPPYHGDRHLRQVLGNEGLEKLQVTFGIGTVDYCIYFLRKAFDHAAPESHLGFVLTNSVRSGKNLNVGLRFITDNGGTITNAISERDWTGDANVTVSIVNLVKSPKALDSVLDGSPVAGIAPTLNPEEDFGRSIRLSQNEGIGYVGYFPLGKGWDLSQSEIESLIESKDAQYEDVIAGFITGDDLYAKPKPTASSHKIFFGKMRLEQAELYPKAMAIVRQRVKPEREKYRDSHRKTLWENWWQWAEPRPALSKSCIDLNQVFGVVIHTSDPIPVWFDPNLKANHGIVVFPSDDFYLFGLIASSVHKIWAQEKSSSLGKSDRYLREEVLMHFPFPDASEEVKEEIRGAARAFSELRDQICLDWAIGPRIVHKKMGEGAYRELSELQTLLNMSVSRAYGLKASKTSGRSEVLNLLFELNSIQGKNLN